MAPGRANNKYNSDLKNYDDKYLNNQEVATVVTMTTTDLGTASQECKTIKDSAKVCNTRADPTIRPM